MSIIAGLMLLAAFPPVGAWWTAPIGVAVLVRLCGGLTGRQAYSAAFQTYAVLFLPLLEWTRYVGVVPWIALALLEASIAATIGPLVVAVGRRVAGRRAERLLFVAAVVGAVVTVEAVRARVPFGGLTWGRLAFGQSDGPLLGWAAWGGAPAVSAAVVLTGLGLSGAWDGLRSGRSREVFGSTAAVAVVVLMAVAIPTPTDGPEVQVAAVQGNVPRAGIDAFAEDLVVLDNHLARTRELAESVAQGVAPRPDLVIWPENAADQDPRQEPQTRQRLDAALDALGGQAFLLGAVLRDAPGVSSNALLVWGRGGVQGRIYRKQHLVPFGEYLPLRSLFERLYPSAGELLPRDFTAGSGVGLLALNGIPLAVGTCFEVAFDSLPRDAVRAGGQLLVLPSNNASYGRSAQSAQQLAMARLRAVEHGRSTIVATTSGISALVRPDGRVIARSGLYEPAVLSASLPRRTQLTFATRHGAAVERSLIGLLPLALLAGWRRRRPTGTAATPTCVSAAGMR